MGHTHSVHLHQNVVGQVLLDVHVEDQSQRVGRRGLLIGSLERRQGVEVRGLCPEPRTVEIGLQVWHLCREIEFARAGFLGREDQAEQ